MYAFLPDKSALSGDDVGATFLLKAKSIQELLASRMKPRMMRNNQLSSPYEVNSYVYYLGLVSFYVIVIRNLDLKFRVDCVFLILISGKEAVFVLVKKRVKVGSYCTWKEHSFFCK